MYDSGEPKLLTAATSLYINKVLRDDIDYSICYYSPTILNNAPTRQYAYVTRVTATKRSLHGFPVMIEFVDLYLLTMTRIYNLYGSEGITTCFLDVKLNI